MSDNPYHILGHGFNTTLVCRERPLSQKFILFTLADRSIRSLTETGTTSFLTLHVHHKHTCMMVYKHNWHCLTALCFCTTSLYAEAFIKMAGRPIVTNTDACIGNNHLFLYIVLCIGIYILPHWQILQEHPLTLVCK